MTPLDPSNVGRPGGSAKERYERGKAARDARIKARYGALGLAVSRMAGEPDSLSAWRKGADGEERVAAGLARMCDGRGVMLLHDRRVPNRRTNIDHLAIGPGGVTVIDAKNLRGRISVVSEGGLLRERTVKLMIGGRDRTKLVGGVERQVAVVEAVLAAANLGAIDVRGALCLSSPEGLPLFRRLSVRGIPIDGTRTAGKLAARSGPLDADEVRRVAALLERSLPPCVLS